MRGPLAWATIGAVLVGLVSILVVAPVAVDSDIVVAYGALATSPNLAATLGYIVFWSSAVAALGAAVSIASRTATAAVRTGLSMLVVGVAWMSLILVTATMSNAIADAGSTNVLPEALAGSVSWLGVPLSIVGSLIVLLHARRAKDERGRTADTHLT